MVRRLDNHLGPIYEEAFRDHLRWRANTGQLGEALVSPDIVAIGPWWCGDGQDRIAAVALAEPAQTRVPVLVGEAKWTQRVHGGRVTAQLARKASALTDDIDTLCYAVCAREEVTRAEPNMMSLTAADMFNS
ncbi:MAG: DUF234 domain-containing protein [Mycobacteriales bacterium]